MIHRDFAIYTGEASWPEEITALSLFLPGFSYSFELVNAVQINSGILMEDGEQRYRALIMPGGNVYPRCVQILPEGKSSIRKFVESGGGYLGFCAGAFFAASTVCHAAKATGAGAKYNQASDYATYRHDLALFKGTATGPVGWAPFTYFGMDFEPVVFNTENPFIKKIGTPSRMTVFGQGGPFFTMTAKQRPDDYTVWARAEAPEHVNHKASKGDGKATVISFKYGAGNVLLSSYHPTIAYRCESDEDIYHSLNLLKAYLDNVLGRLVAPLRGDRAMEKVIMETGKIRLA